MADTEPVEGTVAPENANIPTWLKEWEQDVSTHDVPIMTKGAEALPPTYQWITLHNFKLFGFTFASTDFVPWSSSFKEEATPVGPPKPGAGVAAELKLFLVAAQRLAYFAFVQNKKARGETDIGPKAFEKWCGVKGQHKGWQPRDGKHKLGGAVDIDPAFNPYIAVANKDRTKFGGEKPEANDTDQTQLDNAIRKPAMTAYDNAIAFAYDDGTKAELFERESGETTRSVWRRFDRASFAVRMYMDVGFASKERTISPTVDEPTRPVGGDQSDRSVMTGALAVYQGDGRVPKKVTDRSTDLKFLENKRQQMVADHRALRRVLVNGRWSFKGGKQEGATATRNPKLGLMSLQEEVVVALCDVRLDVGGKTAALRWGAIDFGLAQNGDIMHFDLGDDTSRILNGASVRPNNTGPGGSAVFYGNPAPKPKPKPEKPKKTS